jgi:hypothetical protein
VKMRGGRELPGCGCSVAVKLWAERWGLAEVAEVVAGAVGAEVREFVRRVRG